MYEANITEPTMPEFANDTDLPDFNEHFIDGMLVRVESGKLIKFVPSGWTGSALQEWEERNEKMLNKLRKGK